MPKCCGAPDGTCTPRSRPPALRSTRCSPGTWFDALDLSPSAAFRREHWLPRLAEAIAHMRSASCDQALVVVIGGRVFGEQGDSGATLGADASCASAAQVEASILGAPRRAR